MGRADLKTNNGVSKLVYTFFLFEKKKKKSLNYNKKERKKERKKEEEADSILRPKSRRKS
jgi:hypothetical protein